MHIALYTTLYLKLFDLSFVYKVLISLFWAVVVTFDFEHLIIKRKVFVCPRNIFLVPYSMRYLY